MIYGSYGGGGGGEGEGGRERGRGGREGGRGGVLFAWGGGGGGGGGYYPVNHTGISIQPNVITCSVCRGFKELNPQQNRTHELNMKLDGRQTVTNIFTHYCNQPLTNNLCFTS